MTEPEAPFLLLMRHGATQWNRQDRLNSRTDTSILATNAAEIEAMGRRLRSRRLVRLLSSPSRRALQTAGILAQELSLEVEVEELLREVDFGGFEGKTQHELTHGPLQESYAAWRSGEDDVLGAENLGHAASRAAQVMERIQGSPVPILAVSHGVFIRVLLAVEVLGMPVTAYRRLRVDNARLCSISKENGLTRLVELNSGC